MATENQANLLNKNVEYASNFKGGDLALPPTKKYAVGKSSHDLNTLTKSTA